MRETANPAMDKITSLSGGTGVRLSTWNDPEVRGEFQYYEVIEQIHRESEIIPPIPEYAAINEVLSRMTWAAVQGRKSTVQALRDASEECTTLLAHYRT
jgi:multiple sugar transport system substrate-binding protein